MYKPSTLQIETSYIQLSIINHFWFLKKFYDHYALALIFILSGVINEKDNTCLVNLTLSDAFDKKKGKLWGLLPVYQYNMIWTFLII